MGLCNHSTNSLPKGSILPQNPGPTLQRSRKILELLLWGGGGNGELSLLLWEGFLLWDPARMGSGDRDRERHLGKELLLKPQRLCWAWLRGWDSLESRGKSPNWNPCIHCHGTNPEGFPLFHEKCFQKCLGWDENLLYCSIPAAKLNPSSFRVPWIPSLLFPHWSDYFGDTWGAWNLPVETSF